MVGSKQWCRQRCLLAPEVLTCTPRMWSSGCQGRCRVACPSTWATCEVGKVRDVSWSGSGALVNLWRRQRSHPKPRCTSWSESTWWSRARLSCGFGIQ